MKNKVPRSEYGGPTSSTSSRDPQTSSTTSSTSDDIREWVEESTGWFKSAEILKELGLDWDKGRKLVSWVLRKMVADGEVTKDQNKYGYYRRINTATVKLDLLNVEEEKPVKIISPLDLTTDADFSPGQIYLVSGVTNSGKTTWCLNIAKDNAKAFNVHYINMESGAKELANTIKRFPDIDVKWFVENVNVRTPAESGQNLGDLIIPGEGNLNIIDFLTPPGGDYSQMEKALNDIFERLDGAMCVIAMMQWPTAVHPAGGHGTLSRCRFAIALLKEVERGGKRTYLKVLKDKVSFLILI
jgi:hypothetical protein